MKVQVSNTNTPNWRDITVKSQVPTDLKCLEILAKNNKIYKYGFEVLKDTIISEWLFEKRVNKFYAIFERENNNVSMKPNKISGLVNIDEKTLFLNKRNDNKNTISNIIFFIYFLLSNAFYIDLNIKSNNKY